MRTPVGLYLLALAVRAVLLATFPDPAYPDSYYYADVGRAIAAGHGLNVDFVWIFAEVGNRLPDPAVLPIPSNAHWLPLASFLQAPFVSLLGPTAVASAVPMALVGALAAPLTWAIARDAGTRPLAANAAGVLSAVPGAATVFMAQPENFAILHPLVAAALWATARGLRGDRWAFVLAGLFAGLASLARNDGVLLAGAIGLVWLADQLRWWRVRGGRRARTRSSDRPPISWTAGVLAAIAFLVVMGPWWARQLVTFGSLSPTSSSGAALWIRDISEWNSITAQPSLASWLAQGPTTIVAHDLGGLAWALASFAVFICAIVLVPFLVIGAATRLRSLDFQPWFVYTFVAFAGATLIYPLHVPGGAFIHTAIGLAPHAAILSVEGVLIVVGWIAGRRGRWQRGYADSVFVWGVVAIVVASSLLFARQVQAGWDSVRQPRLSLAAYMAEAEADPATGMQPSDRVMSIDAAGIKWFTGHPGIVSPDDPIETIEAVARAYDIRWLVIERGDAARALGPVLAGQRPSWVGAPVFAIPAPDGGLVRLALFPVCFGAADARCGNG